ncbi:MAG: outer membrane protein assembly factor BamA [Planctomycetota bacterium]
MPSAIPDRPAAKLLTRAAGAAVGVACAVMFGMGASPAFAQATDPEFAPLVGVDEEDPFEGQVIRRVTVRTPTSEPDADGETVYGSLPADLDNRARNAIRSYPGGPYRTETVRGDVDRLSRLISFRTVRTSVLPLADGSIELIFTLTEQAVVADIQVTGNRALTDQRLAQEVGDVLVGGPVERFQIERAARRMESLYRERGYYRAEVLVDEQELDDNGIVLFRVREGSRVRITDIRFVGNNTFGARFLRREIETRKAGIFRRGQIEPRTLDTDVGALIAFYRDRGYLDVRADRRITPSRDGAEAIIEFLIDEGPRYTFRDLKVEFIDADDPVFTVEQLTGLMSIRPGDVYGAAGVQASVDVIRDAYGSLGHTDAAVVPAELRDPDRPQVDLLLRIDPGPRYKTGEVIIAGNEITRQNVIRRHVEVIPGEPLSMIGIERTERRLEQTQLFSPLSVDRGVKITLQPPDAAEPGYRDVLIEVEETNTGSVNFGGAVSSDAGFFGSISLTQRNYDVSDTPDSTGEFLAGRAFRGGGQTFSLVAQPGVEFQRYSLGLSEPFLFDTDYSGSASVFFRTRDFDNFDEERLGTNLSVGRRLGTRWVGSAPIRLERVDIGSIPPDDPIDIVESQGEAIIVGLGLRLNRRTVDSRFLPSRGTLTTLGVEQVVGDFEFTRIDASYEVFLPLRGDFLGRSTVMSFATRASYIPQGPDSVPSYERLYQGGQQFRGFQFRTISPRSVRADNGEPSDVPVGGTWSYFAGLELRQPIVEDNVHIVGFLDSGTVLNEIGLDEYRVSVGVGLRLAVPQLSPAPLAFDFGFPIVKEDDDEGRLFSFSIDIPF